MVSDHQGVNSLQRSVPEPNLSLLLWLALIEIYDEKHFSPKYPIK